MAVWMSSAESSLEPGSTEVIMTIVPLLHRLFTVATLLLMAPALSYALSIYDIIQLSKKNYSDQDIVSLIQATDSAFTLKADDIVRLQGLGLSEPVIQAMVQAIPEQSDVEPPATYPVPADAIKYPAQSSVTHNGSTHKEHTAVSSTQADSKTVKVTHGILIAGGRFNSGTLRETRSGHHDHSAVNLAGVQLLVLRAEGQFSSVTARANAIVKRLDQAASVGEGTFHSMPTTTGDSVMFYGRGTDRPVLIMEVSQSDAVAYQRRSGQTVTPTLLATYWSDLLSDYWSITINQVTPERLSYLHDGEVLTDLYDQWGKLSGTQSAQLADAVQLLSRQQQQHLLRLAISVPRDFVISDSHLARQP